jgi:hypothetical protein
MNRFVISGQRKMSKSVNYYHCISNTQDKNEIEPIELYDDCQNDDNNNIFKTLTPNIFNDLFRNGRHFQILPFLPEKQKITSLPGFISCIKCDATGIINDDQSCTQCFGKGYHCPHNDHKQEKREKICYSCEKLLIFNAKRCSKCKVAIYCDRNCQKNHWIPHKFYCKINQ